MSTGAIIECVPNFSEGSDLEKVRAIVASMQVEGVQLLDWSMDEAHNRSVVTIAGSPEAVVEAAVRSVGQGSAADRPDATERGASAHRRGRRGAVCAGERHLAGRVRGAGAAGGTADLAAIRGSCVLLRCGCSAAGSRAAGGRSARPVRGVARGGGARCGAAAGHRRAGAASCRWRERSGSA